MTEGCLVVEKSSSSWVVIVVKVVVVCSVVVVMALVLEDVVFVDDVPNRIKKKIFPLIAQMQFFTGQHTIMV